MNYRMCLWLAALWRGADVVDVRHRSSALLAESRLDLIMMLMMMMMWMEMKAMWRKEKRENKRTVRKVINFNNKLMRHSHSVPVLFSSTQRIHLYKLLFSLAIFTVFISATVAPLASLALFTLVYQASSSSSRCLFTEFFTLCDNKFVWWAMKEWEPGREKITEWMWKVEEQQQKK